MKANSQDILGFNDGDIAVRHEAILADIGIVDAMLALNLPAVPIFGVDFDIEPAGVNIDIGENQ